MPYFTKNKCIYKKITGKKVGCTKKSIKNYMKALHANINENLDTSKAGKLTFLKISFDKIDGTKVKTEYSIPNSSNILQLFFELIDNEADYVFGKIVDPQTNQGDRFEDPYEAPMLSDYDLTGDDIEMAGQDSYDKINQNLNDKTLNFESLFNKIMNNGK